MTSVLMFVFAVIAVIMFGYAWIMRKERDESRAILGDWMSAVDDWMLRAQELESMLTDAQMHAYNLQRANGNGHKSELPLIVGKSNTKIVMVEESPVIAISEFKNRKGETVKLETVKETDDSKETETDAPALPETDSILGSDEKSSALETSTDKIADVRAAIDDHYLADDEKALIEKWESKKPESVAEYVKRLNNRRNSGKGK